VPPFFEGTSIIHQDNGNDHGQKMGGRATARIKIIIHQHTDKIQFFVEGKPLELHRSFFNFKLNMYNLYLRNPQAERNVYIFLLEVLSVFDTSQSQAKPRT
jgi:hypothetical protein